MTPTPRTNAFMASLQNYSSSFEIFCERVDVFARQLERENTELLERLADRTHSHTLASMRDVQTIQRQSVEITAMRNILAEIYDIGYACADGAPDASDHDKLCNELASLTRQFSPIKPNQH